MRHTPCDNCLEMTEVGFLYETDLGCLVCEDCFEELENEQD